MLDTLMQNLLPVSFQHKSERLAFLALAAAVSVVVVSIAASGFLLGFAIPAYGWVMIRHRRWSRISLRVALPLLLFFLWTVLTALVSADVLRNLIALKKFFIYLIILMVPLIVRGQGALALIYRAIFFFALCLSLRGIEQSMFDTNQDILHRITGFTSHWMTFSGLLMLVLTALCAYALCCGWRRHKWIIPLGVLLTVPLIFSLTRNAWLGAIAGITVILVLLRPRAIAGLGLLLVAMYVLSPDSVRQRFSAALDPEDPNTKNRVELFETAVRLIRDNPWVGVGQQGVRAAAQRYRGNPEYPDWMYQHMHNNFFQLAAERGIPGLALWLWVMCRMAWDAWKVYLAHRTRSITGEGPCEREALLVSSAALGAFAALITAGMFEYNFGDAEILTLYLFMMSAPYVYLNMSREERAGDNRHATPTK